MKLVLLSGAGLSATSGLPTYEDVVEHPLYKKFTSVENKDALPIVELIKQEFEVFSPSAAHRVCANMNTICRSLNVNFMHYTLNVDDLIEQAGGEAVHLYGCINIPQSMIDYRFEPQSSLDKLMWESGDIIVFMGISDEGLPLAFLESKVLEAGGVAYHYNLERREHLVGEQILGDLVKTLSRKRLATYIPIEFEIMDLGFTEAHIATFSIRDRTYEMYFTPIKTTTMACDELSEIEKATGIAIDDYTYEIKFDLKINRENETTYARPKTDLTITEMFSLGDLIVAVASSHFDTFDVSHYVATAQYQSLNSFYVRLAKSASTKVKCEYWCGLGKLGNSYAFRF